MKERVRNALKRVKIRKYSLLIYTSILLCGLLISSVLVAVSQDSSLVRYFGKSCAAIQNLANVLRKFVNIEAITKIGEAIGLCSFLIAWIYASLDKRELGFRYSELLQELYPGYHHFVVLHAVSFIVCMWMCKLGKMEPAALALILLLVGITLQWNVLKNLILFTKKRVKIALDRWKRLVNDASKKSDSKELLRYIHLMAEALVLGTDSCHRKLFSIFTHATEQYVMCPKLIESNQWETLIQDLAKIWCTLLDGRKPSEQGIFVSSVFQECTNELGVQALSLGYLLYLYDKSIQKGLANEPALRAVSKEINTFTQHLYRQTRNEENIRFYLMTGFALLVWLHFLGGNIGIDRELFRFALEKTIEEKDKPWLRGLAQTVFNGKDFEKHLKIVFRQFSVLPAEVAT